MPLKTCKNRRRNVIKISIFQKCIFYVQNGAHSTQNFMLIQNMLIFWQFWPSYPDKAVIRSLKSTCRQMWVSFDSEFNTDHEYFDMLADLMPLLVKPTDKKLIIIEKKTISSLIHKESQHRGLQTSRNDLYRVITDITRILNLISIFTLFGFRKIALLLMQYTHYRGRPQGEEATAGRSRVVEWWVGRGTPGFIHILWEFGSLRRLLFLQKLTLTWSLYFQLFLPKF